MDNVVKLVPLEVGEGFRFDADEILEQAKGQSLSRVFVLGDKDDGELWVSGSANAGEMMVLMEKAKRLIVFGES